MKWMLNELNSLCFFSWPWSSLSYELSVTEKLELSIDNVMTGIYGGSVTYDQSKLTHGSNTIQQILSKEAVSRELQGHGLIESALITKLRKYLHSN